jgi:hypothetical protein
LSGKGAELQFRLEAFNAFDTTNLFNPINNLADPLFGKSTTALPGPHPAGLGALRILGTTAS